MLPATPAPAGDPRLARFIRRELAAEPLRVPSLIVTIWGDALAPRGAEYWLSTILRLAAPFRFNERAVRTGMFRLHRGGWVEPRAVGRRSRYRLTNAGAEGFERAFHRVYDTPFPSWNGRWDGVIAGADVGGPAIRKRLRDQLAWAGYGRFGLDVFLRPARDDHAAERIADALGIRASVTAMTAREPRDAGLPLLRDRAEQVWALASLGGDYRRFLARFAGIASLLDPTVVDAEQAFVVRTLLVHAYRRVRLRDPQLPRELLAGDWPGAQAYDVARALYGACRPAADRFVRGVLVAEQEASASRRDRPPARFVARA